MYHPDAAYQWNVNNASQIVTIEADTRERSMKEKLSRERISNILYLKTLFLSSRPTEWIRENRMRTYYFFTNSGPDDIPHAF